MNPKMTLNQAQQQALAHPGSSLIVGGPGTGKTTVLLALAERLIRKGETVALVTFAFRAQQYLQGIATPQQQALFPKMMLGTVRDLAIRQLHTAGQSFSFASNNQVREILRTLIPAKSFPGTLEDAEHIVRSAKARAKKLPEADRYYPFVQAYQSRLEELGLADRHDIIRRHVLGMRDGTVPPLPVDHLLLDNVQDATELQLIWLQMHVAQGVTVHLTGDDDVTAFGRDGAQGEAALETIASWVDIARFNLEQSYRLPTTTAPAIAKIARQLRSRVSKNLEGLNPAPATIRAEVFPNAPAEHAYLAETCQQLAHRGSSVGVITRTHFEAAVITHALRKHGLNPASYARLIWEEPTPQIVLSLLYLMLGQGTNSHLHLAMIGFGVPPHTIATLFQRGFNLEVWAAHGYPLPPMEGESPTTVAALQQVRRSLRGSSQMLQGQLPEGMNPRSIFKSMVADMLPSLPESEHAAALLATEMLLGLSGKLTEVLPRVRAETLPDMSSPITVAPVREVRNQQFDLVILPYASPQVWPHPASVLMGPDPEHDRRLFYLAITRGRGDLLFTRHTADAPTFLMELQQHLKQQARKA